MTPENFSTVSVNIIIIVTSRFDEVLFIARTLFFCFFFDSTDQQLKENWPIKSDFSNKKFEIFTVVTS